MYLCVFFYATIIHLASEENIFCRPSALIALLNCAVCLAARTSLVMSEDSDINPYKQCEEAIKEIEKENHATIVDDSPSRLQYTWLSQQ